MLQDSSSSSYLERESGSRESLSSAHGSPPFMSSDAVFAAAAAAAAASCQAFVCDPPGAGPLFVPTVTDVTTSRELQWMVQPTVIASGPRKAPHDPQALPVAFPPGSCCPDSEPYPLGGVSTHPLASISHLHQQQQQHRHHQQQQQQHVRPHGSNRGGRRRRDDDLNPADAEKRRVRRERNKQAAARCRNRRQELTERLQAETDELEDEGAGLKSEIERLKKDKERLEFILAAHRPVCKMPSEEESEREGMAGASPCLSHLLPKREEPSSLAPPPPSRSFAPAVGDCAMQPAPEVSISGSYYFDLEPLSSAGAPACALAYTGYAGQLGYPGHEGHGGYAGYASYPAASVAVGGGERGSQEEAGGCASYVGSLRHLSASSSGGGSASGGGQESPDSLGSPTLLAL
ncbi:protein FosB-like [Petromyzon marinus]|uniref:protein FosB-like n=1 Tax=Petromyzon marinus TaxID=7757 RepID=UPI003F707C7D